MKLTNKFKLPEQFGKAIVSMISKPNNDIFRVTRLISPPRLTQLQIRKWDEIVADVSDYVWLLFGTANHMLLQGEDTSRYRIENRITIPINGHDVSGAIDLYDRHLKMIRDWKTASVWKYKMGDHSDWEKQFNIYAHLVRTQGEIVENLQAIVLFKDWHESGTVKEDYPKSAILPIDIKLWEPQKTYDYIVERVKIHADSIGKSDDELPECTADEMWEKPTVYAVMLDGRKTALKLHQNHDDAINHASNIKNAKVEIRNGDRLRCSKYCPVAKFCSQYKKYLETKG